MRAFISYGRDDAGEFAGKLAQWLRDQGHEPWLDVETGIPVGESFDVRIERGIADSELLIALLSHWSVREGSFCRNELLYAQAEQKPIIPVRIADVTPPIQIISLNYIDVCDDPEAAFDRLPVALEQAATSGSMPRRDWPSLRDGPPWWAEQRRLGFEEELMRHGGHFVGRDWLFDDTREWISLPDSRLLLLTGEAGVGKSAIAAKLTAELGARSVHFCTIAQPESCHPKAWLSELVYQLAGQFNPYANRLQGMDEPSWDKTPEALFRQLISDPLLACKEELETTEPWVFVIDGLDESIAEAGSALVDLLAHSLDRMPEWLRLIVTSRPDQALEAGLRRERVHLRHLDAESEANREDVERYVARRVRDMMEAEVIPEDPDATRELATTCSGNFLFASKALDALGESDPEARLSLDELGTMPPGLGGLYYEMFRKRFADTESYDRYVGPALECLVAAIGPLPEDLMVAAIGTEERDTRRGLRALSQFLDRSDMGLRLFHKSVEDWLTDRCASADFAVPPEAGHKRLAQACWTEFEADPLGMSDYAWAYLPTHLARARRWDDLLVAITSRDLGLLPRWIQQGIGEQGLECLMGVISHGDASEEARSGLVTQVARIYASRGEYDTARSLLEDVLAHTSARQGRRAHAVAWHEVGSLHLYHNEMEEATRCYRQALRLCKWWGGSYPDEAAANRVALATVAMRQYQWTEVMKLAGRAADEAQQADDPAHVTAAERLIGVALTELGRYEEAQSKFDGALELAQRLGVTVEEARILLELARLQYGQATLSSQSPTDAAATYEQALSVAERLGDLHCQVEANIGLGRCALAEGRIEEAAARFEESASQLPPGMHVALAGKCRMGAAAVAYQAGRLGEAGTLYGEAADFAEENDLKWLFVTGLVAVGAVSWRHGAESEAERVWDKARREAAAVSPHLESIAQAYIAQCQGSSGVAPA